MCREVSFMVHSSVIGFLITNENKNKSTHRLADWQIPKNVMCKQVIANFEKNMNRPLRKYL